MAETRTASNTLVRHPDGVEVKVARLALGGAARARGRRRAAGVPATVADELAAIASALESQGLNVADRLEIAPSTAPGRRRAPVRVSEPVELEVALAPGEAAVLLVESEGVYAWQTAAPVAPATRRRGAGADRRAVFRLPLAAAGEPPRGRRRGWLADRLIGVIVEPIRAVVLTFVADKVIDAVTGRLEENVVPGLTSLASDDPSTWKAGAPIAAAADLPAGRPPRILLLIHGTFSSTAGSFGALGLTPWGRDLLALARRAYDLVLGFDHPTLSLDPEANAKAMLDALRALDLPAPPAIDAVAFSRGGLVYRCFAERLLPASGWGAQPGRAVFVGCTNGGTALAEPDNWHTLLDLYTNLAAAGARVLSLLGGGVAGTILAEAVKTLGGLARAIVVQAIEQERVPGLAAMEPDSKLVESLNTAAAAAGGDPPRYYAITADFEPDLRDPPPGIGPRLLQVLGDRVIDRLMGEANDLVVDTEAMTQFGTRQRMLVDRLDFETTGAVYHTIYFPQPALASALGDWLGLTRDVLDHTGAGQTFDAPLVVTQFDELDAGLALGKAIERMTPKPPFAPVVIRWVDGPDTRFYARRAADLIVAGRGFPAAATLVQALDLHEYRASETHEADQPTPPTLPRNGRIILAGDTVTGLVVGPLSASALEVLAPAGPQPRARRGPRARMASAGEPPAEESAVSYSGANVRRRRRARASETRVRPAALDEAEAGAPAAAPSTVPCHVHAEMAEQPAIEKPARLLVILARAELDRPLGPTAARGTAQVQEDRELILQVVPRKNCRVVGSDREVVDVPQGDDKPELVFEIQGEAPGEAELWVEARQGARRLLTLVLQPVFVARDATIRASAVGSAADPQPSLVELLIYEDDDIRPRLLFVLRSDDLGLNESAYSDRLREKGKADYVDAIYGKVESFVKKDALQYQDFMAELRDLGSLIYEELVPKSIREKLWDVRERVGSIRVISQEPAIPWELAHLKEPGKPLPPEGNSFLAEKGLVRWLHNLALPPARLPLAPANCRYLVPDYELASERLPGAAAERRLLQRIFKGAKAVKAERRPVRELLATPGSFDLLHVACHGTAESAHIWEAGLVLRIYDDAGEVAEEAISMATVSQSANLRHPDGTRPIVCLNACQVGRRGRTITGTGGLAEAFLRQGAGVLIGTLWSIADDEALTFARTFYERFAAGDPLIRATTAARAAAAAAEEPTWLAYSVYGHPYASLAARAP